MLNEFNPDEQIVPNTESEVDFEEISSDEVDRIVAALEELMETVTSENICYHLQEATNEIYHLIYEDDAEDDVTSEAA